MNRLKKTLAKYLAASRRNRRKGVGSGSVRARSSREGSRRKNGGIGIA